MFLLSILVLWAIFDTGGMGPSSNAGWLQKTRNALETIFGLMLLGIGSGILGGMLGMGGGILKVLRSTIPADLRVVILCLKTFGV